MTDATDTAESSLPESREGKRARHFKNRMMDLLEEVTEVMNEAGKEGFEIQFSIQPIPEGVQSVAMLKIIKTW